MRELIGFDGAVECRAATGPVNLILQGFERGAGAAGSRHRAAAFFSGAHTPTGAPSVPSSLTGLRLFELEDATPRHAAQRYLLRSAELQLEFEAASLQLQRDAGREFFAAVPPPPVPWRLRLGWTALLWLLRLPGAGVLLSRLRGSK